MNKELFRLVKHKKKFSLDFNNKIIWLKNPGQVMRMIRFLLYNKK